MSAKYAAIISRDFQKKRKKWIDGEVTIDNSSKTVKVFELSDAGDKTGRQVYSGIVDAKLLSKLVETEEVKLGSVLVCISEMIPVIDKNSHEREPIADNVSVAPSGIYLRPKGLPFKTPSGFNGQLVSSKISSVNVTTSASFASIGLEDASSNVVEVVPLETKLSAAPLRAGCLSSMRSFSCPSSRTGNCSSNNITASSVQSTKAINFHLKTLYNFPHRTCQVDHTFRSPQHYAQLFSAATAEEIQLSLASAMSNLESRTLNVLGISEEKLLPSSSKVLINSNGTANGSIQQIPRKPLVSKSSSAPSIEAIVIKVRSAGIPLTTRVDVIVSPVRDDENSCKGGPKKWSKGRDDLENDDGQFDRAGKRCKTENDCDGESEKTAVDAAASDGTKLYFKVSDGKHRSSPQGLCGVLSLGLTA